METKYHGETILDCLKIWCTTHENRLFASMTIGEAKSMASLLSQWLGIDITWQDIFARIDRVLEDE